MTRGVTPSSLRTLRGPAGVCVSSSTARKNSESGPDRGTVKLTKDDQPRSVSGSSLSPLPGVSHFRGVDPHPIPTTPSRPDKPSRPVPRPSRPCSTFALEVPHHDDGRWTVVVCSRESRWRLGSNRFTGSWSVTWAQRRRLVVLGSSVFRRRLETLTFSNLPSDKHELLFVCPSTSPQL